MNQSSFFVNISLLKQNTNFRRVFVARTISVMAFGILLVAVPVQVHQLTGSTVQVSLAMLLDGIGMFTGLLCGGVLADRVDRRKLILAARGTCGLGFLMLALNGFLAEPSLLLLYLVSAWDGFFGAIGITALMAATPGLVGRENLAAAGALTMLTTRLAAVLAPAIGGIIIAGWGVNWNYLIAGFGTLLTLLPLRLLPSMDPLQNGHPPESPIASLLGGFRFLLNHSLVGAVILFGTLQLMTASVRVLFPSLADEYFSNSATVIGLMYAAIPFGAMLAASTSGWVHSIRFPGKSLMLCALTAFAAVAVIGLIPVLPVLLILLVLFGYFGAISSLLQFTLVQDNTPDEALGRVNSLWAAQDVVGESFGAVLVGLIAKLITPLTAMTAIGGAGVALGSLLYQRFRVLRTYEPVCSTVPPALAAETENS